MKNPEFLSYTRKVIEPLSDNLVDVCLVNGWSPEVTRNNLFHFVHGLYAAGLSSHEARGKVEQFFLQNITDYEGRKSA